MQFIDAHTHAYPPDDLKLLKERLAMLDAHLDDADPDKWQINGGGLLPELAAMEQEAGVDRFVLLPVTGRAERASGLNRWVAEAAASRPEVIPFGILHPQGEVEQDLRLLLELGLKGVKLHPFIQRFSLDEPAVDHLFESLARAGLPVLLDTIHAPGLLRAKPHLKPFVDLLGLRSCEPAQIARAARRFPELRIIAAHGGCLYGWDRLGPLMELDNVYLDISFLNGLVEPERLVGIIRRKGPERVIYGSDAPWRRPLDFRRWFEDLPLTPGEKEQVASGSLSELLRL